MGTDFAEMLRSQRCRSCVNFVELVKSFLIFISVAFSHIPFNEDPLFQRVFSICIYLLANIGVDTAENEPLKVWRWSNSLIPSPPEVASGAALSVVYGTDPTWPAPPREIKNPLPLRMDPWQKPLCPPSLSFPRGSAQPASPVLS